MEQDSMSFYLDDCPDDDPRTPVQRCPLCAGTSFYDDPVTGSLTCASCYTQSQTATQEVLDYDEGIGLAARGGKKTYTTGGAGTGERGRKRPLAEYDRSRKLPDAEGCCLAFQWLLRDASQRVSKLAGIHEDRVAEAHHWDQTGDGGPPVLERTVERIWFAYLHAWGEATREYSEQYPECRMSFRDYFLDGGQKGRLRGHLSVTVGKRVEEEMLEEMREELRRKRRENPYRSDDDDDNGDDDEEGSLPGASEDDSVAPPVADSDRHPAAGRAKKARRSVLTIAQLCKHALPSNPCRFPNGLYRLHPHQAVLKLQPSLTLLLSILQLALTHLRTGIAPHHVTGWVANGQLPHGLNGYARLPKRHKKRIDMVKTFFMRSFVPPAEVLADTTDMLATACSWNGGEMVDNEPSTTLVPKSDVSNTPTALRSSAKSSATHSVASGKKNATAEEEEYHQKSLYNVPLLAARMVQDFGFDQRVLDNTLELMGVESARAQEMKGGKAKGDTDRQTESKDASVDQSDEIFANFNNAPALLKCTAPDKLYTPMHVAAVIVLACKLCPGWETWKISNLHAAANAAHSHSKQQSPPAFVPWNESQFQLLGNGSTLDYYLDFLEETVLSSVEPSANMSGFFKSLKKDTAEYVFAEESVERKVPVNKAKITPCILLAGASNPNDSASSSKPRGQRSKANNNGQHASPIPEHTITVGESQHPHYCRLLEHMCFVIEETNSVKLHDMAEEILLSYYDCVQLHRPQRRNSAESKSQEAKAQEDRDLMMLYLEYY